MAIARFGKFSGRIFLVAAFFLVGSRAGLLAAGTLSADSSQAPSAFLPRLLLALGVLAAAKAALVFWRRATVPMQHFLPLAWWRSALRRAGLAFVYGGAALIILDIFLPPEFLPAHKIQNFYLPFIAAVAAIFAYDFAPVAVKICKRALKRRQINPDPTLLALIRRLLRGGVILLFVIYAYRWFSGSSFTALLAGLGIGGMAIALAATDTLKNFIAFLIILVDKPFVVGDRVILAGNDGIVEYIGLRTVRLRIVTDNNLVSLPNSGAIDSAAKNISARKFFHRNETLRLRLDTPPEKIQQALTVLRELLADHEAQNRAYPPQAQFARIAPAAYEITFDYWLFGVTSATFAAFNEKINFAILERFRTAGIKLRGQ